MMLLASHHSLTTMSESQLLQLILHASLRDGLSSTCFKLTITCLYHTRVGPESSASKKRRAMAGCRTTEYRSLVPGGISELNCNIKVNKGDSQFMLNILDPPK